MNQNMRILHNKERMKKMNVNIINDIENKLKDLIENDNEVQKLDLFIYYGAPGDGRGNTCIHISVPYDDKLS